MSLLSAILLVTLIIVYLLDTNGRHHEQKPALSVQSEMLGTSQLVPNVTVYGAIIMSTGAATNLELTKTWRDSMSSRMSSDNLTAADVSSLRLAHARSMISQLPFKVVEWPPVFAGPCPQIVHGHRTERGLAMAHYQIWSDFIFFDHDVMLAVERKDFKGEYTSTAFSSTGGVFTAYDNGTLTKNGVSFKDDDIIVIFEDDADIAIKEIKATLAEELSMMTTDILYLGWCNGRLARPVPLCMHAYALTRRGARKLVKYFEPCGGAVDIQLVVMGKNKWVTYRTANPWSYQNNLNSRYPVPHDFTLGIFHQVRIGSFNGHRR